MFKDVIEDLRNLAQKCTKLAREGKNCKASHVLEELGVDLMLKANELERKFDQ